MSNQRIHVIQIQTRLADWPTESCSDHFWSSVGFSLSSWLEIRRRPKLSELVSGPPSLLPDRHTGLSRGMVLPPLTVLNCIVLSHTIYDVSVWPMSTWEIQHSDVAGNVWKTGKSRISLVSLEICTESKISLFWQFFVSLKIILNFGVVCKIPKNM